MNKILSISLDNPPISDFSASAKGQGIIILIDLVARDLAPQDLGENIAIVVGHDFAVPVLV